MLAGLKPPLLRLQSPSTPMKLLAAHALPPGPYEAISGRHHNRAMQSEENEILCHTTA